MLQYASISVVFIPQNIIQSYGTAKIKICTHQYFTLSTLLALGYCKEARMLLTLSYRSI